MKHCTFLNFLENENQFGKSLNKSLSLGKYFKHLKKIFKRSKIKNEQTVGGLSAHKKGGWGVEKRPIKSNKADQISQKPATFGGKPLNHLKKNKKHFRARERRFFIR